MIGAIAGWCVGVFVGWVGWRSMRPIFEGYVFQRQNYRDHRLPTAAGLVICLATAVVVAFDAVIGARLQSISGPQGWLALRVHGPTLVAIVLGFGLLGFIDDVGGVGQHGGFRTHAAGMLRGRLTTGAVKALGAPIVVLAVPHPAFPARSSDVVALLRDVAVICLCANLVNLFDRAPGRAVKVGLLAYLAELVAFRSPVMGPVAIVAGAASALLPADLREELMVGDTGANAFGAAIGFGLVVSAGPATLWVALGVLAALNLSSEFVSFSRVIERVPALSWFDHLGAARRSS